MIEIATWRLNLLRAGYLLIVVGLGLTLWPAILDPASGWEPARGVVVAMLGALSLLALLGLRHPLRMLPLLFWEMAWKALWLLRIALPLWASGRLDASATQTAAECAMAILIAAVVPGTMSCASMREGRATAGSAGRRDSARPHGDAADGSARPGRSPSALARPFPLAAAVAMPRGESRIAA